MTRIQIYFFIGALLLNISVIYLETGGAVSWGSNQKVSISLLPEVEIPKASINALMVFDVLLLITMIFYGLNYFISPNLITKTQGIITIIVCLSLLTFIICNIFLLLAEVFMMIGLLITPIFGTIAYFAKYSSFDKGGTFSLISLLKTLKISMIIAFLYTNIKNITNLGLILLILTPMVLLWVINFVYALVPKFLLQIVDGIAGIVVLIVGLIWCIVFIINSIISLKALISITN